MERQNASGPHVIASASKVRDARANGTRLRFHSEGPQGIIAATRLAVPAPPTRVKVGAYGDSQVKATWDAESGTALLEFLNAPDGVEVDVSLS